MAQVLGAREVRPATGANLRCKGWRQEGILRMLENTVANGERPEELIIYGGTGQAARNWQAFDAIVASLQSLEDDETLVIQSGKPVAIFRSYWNSPRVLIANANLVPRWANREEFFRLRDEGLTMHGQYTAGTWAYIGSQGILQGSFETFAGAAERYFDGSLRSRIVLTAGLGGMSSAQPMAIEMNGGVGLVVEIDQARIAHRRETGHVQEAYDSIEQAWERARSAARNGEAVAIALHANAADVVDWLVGRGEFPDVVTDQTSAHDLLNGYIPSGLSVSEAQDLRRSDPAEYVRRSRETVARHVTGMLAMKRAGTATFEYGNDLRSSAFQSGVENAFDIEGFIPLFIRPSFAEGRGPMRWVLLSGSVGDQKLADAAARRLFPDDARLQRWFDLAESRVPVEGLPARTCWLSYGARRVMALELNRMVRDGELSGPVAISRDHLDAGSCAYPRRETEAMPDGSDAIADWPYLNALLNTSCGADLVSVHQNAGEIGGSASAGMTIILDGTQETDERIKRTLDVDPGIGVVRQADAGVPGAREFLNASDIQLPRTGR
jgi:urocanate hydratase